METVKKHILTSYPVPNYPPDTEMRVVTDDGEFIGVIVWLGAQKEWACHTVGVDKPCAYARDRAEAIDLLSEMTNVPEFDVFTGSQYAKVLINPNTRQTFGYMVRSSTAEPWTVFATNGFNGLVADEAEAMIWLTSENE